MMEATLYDMGQMKYARDTVSMLGSSVTDNQIMGFPVRRIKSLPPSIKPRLSLNGGWQIRPKG